MSIIDRSEVVTEWLEFGILTDRNMRLEKGQQLEVRLDRDMRVPDR